MPPCSRKKVSEIACSSSPSSSSSSLAFSFLASLTLFLTLCSLRIKGSYVFTRPAKTCRYPAVLYTRLPLEMAIFRFSIAINAHGMTTFRIGRIKTEMNRETLRKVDRNSSIKFLRISRSVGVDPIYYVCNVQIADMIYIVKCFRDAFSINNILT